MIVVSSGVCQLSLERKKTHVKFTTFFNEEAVRAIERYLEFEREDIKPDDALFSMYRSGGDHMTPMAIQQSYRDINKFLNWEPDKDGFLQSNQPHAQEVFQHSTD